MLLRLKFYLKFLFGVAARGDYSVTEDRVLSFYSHFLLPLNSFSQLDYPAFPSGLGANVFGCF